MGKKKIIKKLIITYSFVILIGILILVHFKNLLGVIPIIASLILSIINKDLREFIIKPFINIRIDQSEDSLEANNSNRPVQIHVKGNKNKIDVKQN